ncbi:hypothetical protein MBANPS3_007589 [Mucor bainieri]
MVEDCAREDLRSHLTALAKNNALARIVVDECHCAIEDCDWRHQMMNVHLLRTMDVPLILLTATLHPTKEHDLQVAFATKFITIREPSTARPALAYSTVPCRSPFDMDSQLFARLEEKQFFGTGICGIVYVQTTAAVSKLKQFISKALVKKHGEDVLSSVDLVIYHAQMASEEERTQSFDTFMACGGESNACIVFASSALGLGVDKGNVQFVYHRGIPDSMVALAEESGRAARDPRSIRGHADCTVFTCPKERNDLYQMRSKFSRGYTLDRKLEMIRKMSCYVEIQKVR